MVLHIATVGRIFGTIARGFARYNRYESKLFDSAYRGFPRSVRRGARHGYIGGTIAGSLISQNGILDENGLQTPESNNGYFREKHFRIQRYSTRNNKYGFSKYDRKRRPRKCPPVRQQCCPTRM